MITNESPEVRVEIDGVEDGLDLPILESNLASHIRKCYERAKLARNLITERLMKCERQRRGVYDPDVEAQIRDTGGSDIYMMLSDIKSRAAGSWIRDVVLMQQDRTFELKPANSPDLPIEMAHAIIDLVKREAEQFIAEGGQLHPETFRARMEEVHETITFRLEKESKDSAERMAAKIQDQLDNGGFEKALVEFIDDFCTFPTAIIQGPIVRKRKAMKWGPDYTPVVQDEFVREFERVNPFDAFPAPASNGVNDSYFIRRHHLTRDSLEAMIGLPGYDSEAIQTILDRYGVNGFRNLLPGDSERRLLEGKPFGMNIHDETIETIEFWGSVRGEWLLEWGYDGKDVSPGRSYEVNAWQVGGTTFRLALNPDPLGKRPFHIASFTNVPGSFWGFALMEIMRDVQAMCNASARSLANNMSIASGPQVEATVDRLPDGEELTNVYPWKIWQTTSDRTGGGQPAIRFFQPNMNAGELLSVFQHFMRQADEQTGIPNYVYGSGTTGGAGRTASGLSMLMDNAAKGIKQAIVNIDPVISGIVSSLYTHNMRFDPDPYIKGDFKIKVKGSSGLIHKEQLQVRRNEFLQATANPFDVQILGPKGRGYLLRELAKGLQLDTDKIIPDPDSLEAFQMQQEAASQQAQQAALQPVGAPQLPDGGPMGGTAANTMQQAI